MDSRRNVGAKMDIVSATTTDHDALIAEVLSHISQKGYNGAGLGMSTEESTSSTPLREKNQASFEGFPQFQRCMSAEARNFLAYRYLKANRFKLGDTTNMIKKTNEFRKLHGLDSLVLFPSLIPIRGFCEEEICKKLHIPRAEVLGTTGRMETTSLFRGESYVDNHRVLRPIIDTIGSFYASSIHYTDKAGHPVMYGLLGRLKPKELYRELERISPLRQGPKEIGYFFHLYTNEVLEKVARYCDVVKERHLETGAKWPANNIASVTIVLDCDKIHVSEFIQDPFINLLRAMLKLDRHHYPELLHRLVLVNCPSNLFFSWALNHMVSGDGNLKRKMTRVNKTKTFAFLKKIIDEDKIPSFLGGTCCCKGGCVPFNTASLEGNGWILQTKRNSLFQSPETIRVSGPNLQSEQMDKIWLNSGLFFGRGTKNVTLRPRRKHTISYEVGSYEDITWEFVVLHKSVGFTAVFIECSEDGRTQVLASLKHAREVADHFVPSRNGELILTWDNSQSLFTVKRLQIRVHCTMRSPEPPLSARHCVVTRFAQTDG